MTDYESTLLAGIPNAPSVYDLTENPDLAMQRQRQVVEQMVNMNISPSRRLRRFWPDAAVCTIWKEAAAFITGKRAILF